MCDWVGLSYKEAADVLGVPIGTISSRVARAHEHLRKRLGNDIQGRLVSSIEPMGQRRSMTINQELPGLKRLPPERMDAAKRQLERPSLGRRSKWAGDGSRVWWRQSF